MTRSEAEFLENMKTRCGMTDATELELLRELLGRMRWVHIFTWVKPKAAK